MKTRMLSARAARRRGAARLGRAALVRERAGIVWFKFQSQYALATAALQHTIRYRRGRGFHFPLPGAGYLRNTSRNLVHITDFIRSHSPDIVGLVEVDLGSMRSSAVNQAEAIAKATGLTPCYRASTGTAPSTRNCPSCANRATPSSPATPLSAAFPLL